MTNLRDRCLSHFQTLGIPLPPDTLDGALSKAEKESLSHLHFLDQLLGPPAAARHERAVERRIREARFAEPKTLEGFDWKFNVKVAALPQYCSGTMRHLPGPGVGRGDDSAVAVAAALAVLVVSDGAPDGAKEGAALADPEHPATATSTSKASGCRIVSPRR